MADIHKLDNQRRKDKLTAHLALAAEDSPEDVGNCLTSDELADMAANLCSKEQKERALAHFSQCQKCYDGWVAISFAIAAAHRGVHQPRRSLFSGRNIGYLGSAFAIAASVIVFLNVRNVPLETNLATQQSVESEVSIDRKGSEPIEKLPQPEARLQKAPAVPAMVHSDQKEKSVPPAPVAETSIDRVARESSSTAYLNMTVETEKAEGDTGQAPAADMHEPGSRKVDAWLASVKEACMQKSGLPDQETWKSFYQVGRGLDFSTAGNRMQKKIQEVLELIGSTDGDSVDQACDVVLALLAEETDRE